MKPKVSVVTPCYNSENDIHRYLQSLLAQAYPKPEVILVDDGSSDETPTIMESCRSGSF